jgi:tRNA pseudouridine55 synthase
MPGDGLLLVDKPAGVSSHDVVGVARRALGEKRIGHAGTLDPFATGLLVLLVGRATRLLPHVSGDPKVYEATVQFGAETDTEDLQGAVTREAPRPSRAAVLAAIPTLTGVLEQMPPQYSAKRVGGRRAYDIARSGAVAELAPARVRVDRWELLDWRGDACDVRITCGGGTYIRSLARDLGRLTGSAAHLTALRRTRSGAFDVRDAVSLDALRDNAAALRPAAAALPELPTQPVTDEEAGRLARGIDVPATVAGAWGALIHDGTGALVALAERRGDERWQPRVVMRAD